MARQYRIERDQAVWERETWWVEVPDSVKVGDEEDWLYEQVEIFDEQMGQSHLGQPVVAIEDSLEGTDIQLRFTPD